MNALKYDYAEVGQKWGYFIAILGQNTHFLGLIRDLAYLDIKRPYLNNQKNVNAFQMHLFYQS